MILVGIVFILSLCFVSYVSLKFIDYEDVLKNVNKCPRLYAYTDSKIFFLQNRRIYTVWLIVMKMLFRENWHAIQWEFNSIGFGRRYRFSK